MRIRGGRQLGGAPRVGVRGTGPAKLTRALLTPRAAPMRPVSGRPAVRTWTTPSIGAGSPASLSTVGNRGALISQNRS
jgi:hypothetical protein